MIYLIGFSGAGKTSVAKKLAKDLNLKYIDTDELIEKKYKTSINKIFEKSGEIYFRKIESDILKKIKNINIVSCGGGLPCYKNNMDFINNFGKSIYLKASEDELLNRLNMSLEKRPLLNKKNDEEKYNYIKNTIRKREKFYIRANYIIETDGLTINDVLTKINSLPITF